MRTPVDEILQTADTEWLAFPGGELEGVAPRALCPSCRRRLGREALQKRNGGVRGSTPRRLLCFQCYRTGLERVRALQNAARLETASEARFQDSLPFEPVNAVRLAVLKMDRSAARAAGNAGVGRFANRRRRAQIEARHLLRQAGLELARRGQPAAPPRAQGEKRMAWADAVHAAELQLPEAWLPFVVSR